MAIHRCQRPDGPLDATVTLPGSKSMTNRALITAALADGSSVLSGILLADDTRLMIDALRTLGVAITVDETDCVAEVTGCRGQLPASEAKIFCGNAGTVLRFCTGLVALGHGRFELDGVDRMRQRPVGGLTDVLRALGARIEFLGAEGYPPLALHAAGLHGGSVSVHDPESSQFISAVLLAAPYARRDVYVEVIGGVPSIPYLRMTTAMMERFGVAVVEQYGQPGVGGAAGSPRMTGSPDSECASLADDTHSGSVPLCGSAASEGSDASEESEAPQESGPACEAGSRDKSVVRFVVYAMQRYRGTTLPIEPDASNAMYFLSAPAVAGGRVTVRGLGTDSVQGDVRFVDVLERMGCRVERAPSQLSVCGIAPGGRLRGVDVDLSDMPDTVQTLAVLALAAEGPTVIRNVANLRVKETDRLTALRLELTKLGARVDERPDGLTIHPPAQIHPATIDTHDDHRMAMSFALAGLKCPGLVINNPQCCRKSFPDFFDRFDGLWRNR